MIQIARVYGTPSKSGGWRVLVDRLWPRGLTKAAVNADEWMKDIGPSDALRKWFGHEPKRWAGFQKRYRAELTKKKDLLAQIRQAEREHDTVTLLYGAKDEEHNEAVVLRDVLKAKR